MKRIIFFSWIFLSCTTTQRSGHSFNPNDLQQKFIVHQMQGKPGKCYQKLMFNGTQQWTEVLCDAEKTKKLVRRIQNDLIVLGYNLSNEELNQARIGRQTKMSLVAFQKEQGMAYGALDRATINRLALNASKWNEL